MKNLIAKNILALSVVLLSGGPIMAQSSVHPRVPNAVGQHAAIAGPSNGSASSTSIETGGVSKSDTAGPPPAAAQATNPASQQVIGGQQGAASSGAKVCRTEGSKVYYCN